jgi:transposase
MWRFRTGSPWRDLPDEYGPCSTVYDRSRSWATAGVFEQLMQAMIAEDAARGQAGRDLVSVDSTTARAHHHAAGMVLDGECRGPMALLVPTGSSTSAWSRWTAPMKAS